MMRQEAALRERQAAVIASRPMAPGDPEIDMCVIDPLAMDLRAVRVREKAGFKRYQDWQNPVDGRTCRLMKLGWTEFLRPDNRAP